MKLHKVDFRILETNKNKKLSGQFLIISACSHFGTRNTFSDIRNGIPGTRKPLWHQESNTRYHNSLGASTWLFWHFLEPVDDRNPAVQIMILVAGWGCCSPIPISNGVASVLKRHMVCTCWYYKLTRWRGDRCEVATTELALRPTFARSVSPWEIALVLAWGNYKNQWYFGVLFPPGDFINN